MSTRVAAPHARGHPFGTPAPVCGPRPDAPAGAAFQCVGRVPQERRACAQGSRRQEHPEAGAPLLGRGVHGSVRSAQRASPQTGQGHTKRTRRHRNASQLQGCGEGCGRRLAAHPQQLSSAVLSSLSCSLGGGEWAGLSLPAPPAGPCAIKEGNAEREGTRSRGAAP